MENEMSTSALENRYEYFPSKEEYCSRPTYVSDKRRENCAQMLTGVIHLYYRGHMVSVCISYFVLL